MKTACNLVCILLLGWSSLPAQVHMEALTVADGLSQGYITSFLQDSKGFIWMGTFDGLNRYDGYTIRHFKPKPFDSLSIQASHITALYEDADKFIWVGTTKGLFVFDPLKEQFHPCLEGDAPLAMNNIEAITGDKDNNIFVQINLDKDRFTVYRFNLSTHSPSKGARNNPAAAFRNIKPIDSPEGLLSQAYLLECIGDSMILATNKSGQVYRYFYKDNQFKEFDLKTLPQSRTVDHSILWSKNNGYIFRWKLPDGRDSIVPMGRWAWALKIGEGRVAAWLAISGSLLEISANKPISGGIIQPRLGLKPAYSKQDFMAIDFKGQDSNHPLLWNPEAISDRNGIIWLATGGWGARKVNLRQISFGKMLEGRSISSLRELPDGRLWVRQFDDKSYLLNPRDGTITPVPESINRHPRVIYELYVTQEKNIWTIGQIQTVKLENRLHCYINATSQHIAFLETIPFLSDVPEKIMQDQHGNVWIGAHFANLYRCKPGKQVLEHFSYANVLSNHALADLRITAFTQHGSGTLWLGTNHGVLRVDHANDPAPVFSILKHDIKNRQSISMDWVTCICPDPKDPDVLWLGTRGGGLNRLHIPTQTFSFWTEAPNGLPDNVVYGILPDNDGNLWCSTNHGICRFSPSQYTFVTYQEKDGLSSTEFNTNAYLRTRDGRLWFGGVSGLNNFMPEAIHIQKTPPSIALTGIQVRGEIRYPDREGFLSLPFEENNVFFEFAALDFANPATNRFRHRLKGIDREWVNDGITHNANYTALPPGRYTLELQGATADSPWNEQSVVFVLEIRPPWYRSWLAYSCYLLLALGALFGYIRYRVQVNTLRNEAALNQRESERMRSFEALKNQFFSNVAHELRTPLTVIQGLSDRLSRGIKGDSVAENARQILHQSDQLLQLTNQVLDLAKLESNQFQMQLQTGNVMRFIQQHIEALESLASSKGIQLDLKQEPKTLWIDYDPQQLQKVLNNLVSNAIRHTPAGGRIMVSAEAESNNKWLTISVSDTGEGISANDLPHVFDRFFQGSIPGSDVGSSGIGLTLTRDLVQRMGGRVAVASTLGQGSTFSIFLPVVVQTPPALALATPEIRVDKNRIISEKPDKLPLLLVMEDNPDVAAYLRLCLQDDFRLVLVNNGEAGIQKTLELMPDIILTDVAMPMKNGYEVSATLKNDARSSHIPIVMLTAKVEHEDRMEGYRRGANAYLTKPFQESELLQVLHNLLHLQQQWKNRYEHFWKDAKNLAATEHPPEDLQVEDAFMQQLRAIFEVHYPDDSFNLDRLCHLLNMSSSQLDRKLKVLTDQSPMQMLRGFRLQKAKTLLHKNTQISIKEVCFQTGFKNPSHFSRLYAKEFGVPPSAG